MDTGKYRNLANPTALVARLEREHEAKLRDFGTVDSSTEPISFQKTVRPILEERFRYTNHTYAMMLRISETPLESFDLSHFIELIRAAETKLKTEEDDIEEFFKEQEGVKRPWKDARLCLFATVKWVLKRVEKFARAALQARGNTEDKYVNWLGPKGSLDRLWISELERRLEANTTRSPADRKALRAKCVGVHAARLSCVR